MVAGVFYTAFALEIKSHAGSCGNEYEQYFCCYKCTSIETFRPFAKREENKQEEAVLQSNDIEKKEETEMITMKINGMMCPHCQAAVKKALEGFEGVQAVEFWKIRRLI